MKTNDLADFGKLWTETQTMFNRTVSDTAIKLAFSALADFDLEDIKKAIAVSLRESKFAPTVADIVEIIRKVNGEDNASLSAKAHEWYTKLNYNFDSGKDIITDDARAVYAFKMCFGNLLSFGQHDKKSDPFDRKNFVECYVNASTRNIGECYRINGLFHASHDPRVRFIGNENKCLQLAEKIYGKTGQEPRLPRAEQKLIPMKNKISVKFSDECNADLKEMIEKFIADFTGDK